MVFVIASGKDTWVRGSLRLPRCWEQLEMVIFEGTGRATRRLPTSTPDCAMPLL